MKHSVPKNYDLKQDKNAAPGRFQAFCADFFHHIDLLQIIPMLILLTIGAVFIYGIGQQVKVMTGNQVVISPGTMYGTLSKMEGDGLIRFDHEEEKRKLYCMTPLGEEVLETEKKRIRRLYQNSQGEEYHE
mgnify:CR=1 FL=1